MPRRCLVAGMSAGVLAGVVAGLSACGTGSEQVIAPEELQRAVSSTLEQAGRRHEKVSCGEGVKAQVAESTMCTMTAGGERFEVTVIVTDVQGEQASYDVDVAPRPLP